MNPLSISVLILSLNEEKHIARCISSVQSFASNVFVVDSYSSDRTVEIAESLGAKVFRNHWINYATQFNWGLDNLPIGTEWVMRMDADEYVLPALAERIRTVLPDAAADISGFYVSRRVHFMGQWIRRGGYYPVHLLRLWRRGIGRCEERWMDEHIYLIEGRTQHLGADVVDDNLNNLSWWTIKHNGYATREAVDMLNMRYAFANYVGIKSSDHRFQESRKRWLKERVYARLPLGIRPLLYFLFRYIFRLGFLDGYRGLIFHVLQGFWYRFLVDAKIYEMEQHMRIGRLKPKQMLKQHYGIEVE